jgi:hypothetical protein
MFLNGLLPGRRQSEHEKTGRTERIIVSELRSLVDALKLVRRRIFLTCFLSFSAPWGTLLLAGLLAAAALSPWLHWLAVAALTLAPAVLAAAAVRAWRQVPDLYRIAARLDSAAHLKDRLSSAYYFSESHPNRAVPPRGIRERTALDPIGNAYGRSAPLSRVAGRLGCGVDAAAEEFVRRQREDALAHLAKTRPAQLFPVQAPRHAGVAVVLLLGFAGMFTYRLQSGPPLVALWKWTAETPLVKAMMSPIVHAMERNQHKAAEQRQIAENRGPEPQDQRPGTPESGTKGEAADGRARIGRAGREQDRAASNALRQEQQPGWGDQDSGPAGTGSRDQQDAQRQQGQQAPSPEQQGDRQQGNGQGQNGRQDSQGAQQAQNGSRGDRAPESGAQHGEQGSPTGGSQRPSLAQSVVQAIKNLLNSAAGAQSAASRGQESQGESQLQAAAQPSSQPGHATGERSGQAGQDSSQASARDGSGEQQQPGQKSNAGIGTQPGSDRMARNQPLPGRLIPERVPLDAQRFYGEAQVRARAGDATVSTEARNVAPNTFASMSGAERENIPLRYRVYVRRYFERAGKNPN